MVSPDELGRFRALGGTFPLGRYVRDQLDKAFSVLPEQKRARIRALVERKFFETIGEGVTTVEAKRKARVAAAMGRFLANQKGGNL